jgi:phospholipid-binding lipoprotein MlaA
MTKQWRVGLLMAAMALAAPAWADDSKAAANPDPWEGFNRKMYGFNDALDTHALRPVASFYRRVTPGFIVEGVSNFFSNLGEPVTVINQLLQGKVRNAVSDTGRFLLNSTVGVLGLFDVAGRAQIPHHKEDFGQTLGVWGAGPGPYLVLPFLGPSTVRDLSGRGVDYADNPIGYQYSFKTHVVLFALEGVSDRAALIPMEGVIQGDKYLFVRDLYLQHRDFEIHDGKVKDSFLDDSDDDSSDGTATPATPQGAAPSPAAPAPAPGADAAPAMTAPQASTATGTDSPVATLTASDAAAVPTTQTALEPAITDKPESKPDAPVTH